jgi:GNAT superfamily N-acetyltransferase
MGDDRLRKAADPRPTGEPASPHDGPVAPQKRMLDSYECRTYEPGDDEGIVALHNRIWNGGRTLAWFRWKYVDNPYTDGVPVGVATHRGDIVAAFGLVPFRMRAGAETGIGMLGGDLVVDPDHRRRGLFTALLGSVFHDDADRDRSIAEGADFFFSYSNPLSHPGMLKLGWTDVAPRVTHLRIQDPSSFLRDRLGSGLGGALGPFANAANRARLRVRTTPTPTPADVTVTRRSEPPVETLAALAATEYPDGVAPVYDEAFYEWHFTGVDWTCDDVYVARRDGDPVAAVVTRETRDDRLDATTVSLVHTVPLAGERREAGIAATLDRILADHRDADFLRAWNPVFPERLLRERGFLADDRPPLSWARGPDLRLVASSHTGEPFSTEALARSGPALWSLDK